MGTVIYKINIMLFLVGCETGGWDHEIIRKVSTEAIWGGFFPVGFFTV